MKTNSSTNKHIGGAIYIAIGLVIMLLNLLIVKDGNVHMILNTLSKDEDTFFFYLKTGSGLLISLVSIGVGFFIILRGRD